MNNFLFLGGDMRSLYAAEKLNKKYDSFVYGFLNTNINCCVPVLREMQKCNAVVLPIPASVDGEYINAPYFNEPMPLEIIMQGLEKNGVVFAGKVCPKLVEICEFNGYQLIDYLEREEFAVMNAVPSAEGAIEIAMRETARTIFGAEVLITGFGRIAKVLVKYLTALGAKVSVTARKCSDLAWAKIAGSKDIPLKEIDKYLEKFDIVINTIPTSIFGREQLIKFKEDCLIIDLASKPGVADFELAKSVGIKVIWALSLPGKVAPITAGEIISDTIENIISERKLK